VTALRLKALHLASSSDYTYSKSYLGLLSSIGCMLGVMICNVVALPTILKYVKERFRGKKTLLRVPKVGDRVYNVYASQSNACSTDKSPSGIERTISGMSEDEDRASVLTEPLPLYQPVDNVCLESETADESDSHEDIARP
jgi:hypothetical protein